jgi:hypothetical protein
MKIDEIKIKKSEFDKVYKSYQILREELFSSDEEIKELIDYFKQTEDYEICEKLKNKLSNG